MTLDYSLLEQIIIIKTYCIFLIFQNHLNKRLVDVELIDSKDSVVHTNWLVETNLNTLSTSTIKFCK